jgi:hypothetical protein
MSRQSRVGFKNHDIDKMIVNNDKISIENMINQSFNSMIGEDYRSSKLGDSMLKANLDSSHLRIRKMSEEKGRKSSMNLMFCPGKVDIGSGSGNKFLSTVNLNTDNNGHLKTGKV